VNVGLLAITGAWGGMETHTAQLGRALALRGHAARIICLKPETYDAYRAHCGGIDVVLLQTPKDPRSMGFLDWFQFFSGMRLDVCVFAKGWFNEGDWKLDLAARSTFRIYITIEHSTAQRPQTTKAKKRHFGILPGLGLWRHRERLKAIARSRVPKSVVCVSNAGRQRLVEASRFPSERVVTIRNGVDSDRFNRDTAKGRQWRRQHGIPESALLFGAVSRLDTIKGFDIAVSGFQALRSRLPAVDAWLVLIGDGPVRDALEDRARQAELGGRIMFLPFSESPWEPLSAIDVFVMPSLMEGLPLALLEAMACGCCPIATAVGGIPEVLSSPELGWLVPAGHSEAFAVAMIDAASRSPETRGAMGRRARDRVRVGFNASTQFNLLVDHIEWLESVSEPFAQPGFAAVRVYGPNP
jgi:glycosyltransferase involved in cell wall biosynthesis